MSKLKKKKIQIELKKITIKICRNSQWSLTGKRDDACVKKKGPPDKRKMLILFQVVFSPVAALSVNSMLKYKRLRNGTTN